jgi:hypothetical protein
LAINVFVLDLLCYRNESASTLIVAQKSNTSKIGRPKLPKGEAKSCMVRARVTPSEQKAIEKAANGTGVSEWARQILVAAAGHL